MSTDHRFSGGSILSVALGNMGASMAVRVTQPFPVLVKDASLEMTARVSAGLGAS